MIQRGFTLVEAILAFFLMTIAFLVLWSIFTGGARHAMQSRNRTVAMLYAQSWLEEVEAHPWGQPKPKSWNDGVVTPVAVYVEGRPQQMNFTQKVEFTTGAFVDKTREEDHDELKLTLTWSEGIGDNANQKELVVETAVWR